jgi:hypothetical protein
LERSGCCLSDVALEDSETQTSGRFLTYLRYDLAVQRIDRRFRYAS